MVNIKIVCFLLFLSHASLAKPWYEYSKNDEAKKFLKIYLKPRASDRESLVKKIIFHAGYIENVLLTVPINRKKISSELIDRLIYLLIKASDLGSVDAKRSLITIIRKGLYGVDIDPHFADILQCSLDMDALYVEPKPWYSFTGNDDDRQFIENELLNRETAADNILKKSKSFLSDLICARDLEMSKLYLNSFMFLLVKASWLGLAEARDILGNILRNGICGIKRDIEFANILKTELAISRLQGFEAIAAQEFESYVKDFHFDPVSSVLLVVYDKAEFFYFKDEAKTLFEIYSYLKNKHDLKRMADDALLNIKQIFKGLDEVD